MEITTSMQLVYQSVQLSAQTVLICKLDLTLPWTIVSSVLFGYPEQLTHPCHSEYIYWPCRLEKSIPAINLHYLKQTTVHQYFSVY